MTKVTWSDLERLHAQLVDARRMADECLCDLGECSDTCRFDPAVETAEAALAAARSEFRASDEPRPYRFWNASPGSGGYFCANDIECRPSEIEEEVMDWALEWTEPMESTYWVDLEWKCTLPGEDELARYEVDGRVTLTIEPEEPECSSGCSHHAWSDNQELVGGCAENPGCFGSGGSVRIHRVCLLCGMARTRDGWGQRPDTGEQGLETTEYLPGAHAIDVEHLDEDAGVALVHYDGHAYSVGLEEDELADWDRAGEGERLAGWTVRDGHWWEDEDK